MTTSEQPEVSPQNNEKNSNLLARVLIPIAILLVVIFATLFLIRGSVQSTNSVTQNQNFKTAVGETVPNFEIKRYPDEAIVKFSDLKAKVVLINFWATWCEACMVEMPSIIKLRDKYRAQGFEVMAVNVDDQPKAVVPSALKEFNGEVPVYMELDGAPLASLFRVSAIPFSVVVSQAGKILYIETGERDWFDEEMKGLVEKWINP